MFSSIFKWDLDSISPAPNLTNSFTYYRHTSVYAEKEEKYQPSSNYWKEQMIILPELASALLIAGNILVLNFALCGNFAAVIVCLRSKFNRQGTKFFLISLALSDLLLAIFATVISLSQILAQYHSWTLGPFICYVADYLQTVAITVNGFSLIAIAVDRCLAVVRALKPPFLKTWVSVITYVSMILIWLIPLCIAIPLLFAYNLVPFWVWERTELGGRTDEITRYTCIKKSGYGDNSLFTFKYLGALGSLYLVIIIVFISSYVTIIIYLRRNFRCNRNEPKSATTIRFSSSGVTSPTTSTTVPTQRRGRRTARLLMALILLLIICRLPLLIFFLWKNFQSFYSLQLKIIESFLQLMSCLKCAVNPFVYTIWNPALRSPNHHLPPRSTDRICFCFDPSGKCCQSFPLYFMKLSNCGGPRVYDLTTTAKTLHSLIDSPVNTRCFNISERVDGRMTTPEESEIVHTSTSKLYVTTSQNISS